MKSFLAQRTGDVLLSALGTVLPSLYRGSQRPIIPRPNGYRTNINARQTTNYRGKGLRRFGNGNRRYGRRNNNGIEINRNEGGFKNINNGFRYITRACDEFFNLSISAPADGSHYVVDGGTQLDLKALLNENDEFTTYKLLCSKFRLLGIRITFNYARIMPSGSLLNKLILTPQTDLIDIQDPKLNKNSMYLDMSRPGTKNFNFNLNKGNMKEDNVDWIPRASNFEGTLKLNFSEQSPNFNGGTYLYTLGCLKIAFIVKFALEDVGTNYMKLKELIDIKVKDEKKDDLKENDDKIKKLEQEIADLKLGK